MGKGFGLDVEEKEIHRLGGKILVSGLNLSICFNSVIARLFLRTAFSRSLAHRIGPGENFGGYFDNPVIQRPYIIIYLSESFSLRRRQQGGLHG